MSDSLLAQLRESLADHPEREKEVARIYEYLLYQRTLQRYELRRSLGAPSAELLALARQLDAGIDMRLMRNEVSAGEAQLLKSALLEMLEPDQSRRGTVLDLWKRMHLERQATANADPRVAEYEQRQAEIIAAWRAQPEIQRDRDELQGRLDALREVVFGQSR
jgi:hypothetical protein